jgi:transketolase
MNVSSLRLKAKILRKKVFEAFVRKKEAHLGGCFSMIEILLSIYEVILKKKDKFILSKSHASFPLIILLREKGFSPKLKTHLEIDIKNGIYCTTGSLGHGLPIAAGMAFARKIQKKKGNIFVLISDGECQEGTTWETLLIAARNKLNNLIILIDYNKIQALTHLDEGLPLNNLKQKIKAFNCNCYEIINGHSFKEIIKKLKIIKKNSKPNVFIFNTIKGKGIKEFENDPVWHARKLSESDILIGKKRLAL